MGPSTTFLPNGSILCGTRELIDVTSDDLLTGVPDEIERYTLGDIRWTLDGEKISEPEALQIIDEVEGQ